MFEQGPILDDEIARLPESLRLPIILCYLQGLTNREAAKCLGCPEGTIVSRLARARGRLRQRLIRRGVVLTGAAAVTTLLTQMGSAAPLLPELSRAALACGKLAAAGGAAAASQGLISPGAAQLANETLHWLNRRQWLIRLGKTVGIVMAAAVAGGLLMLMKVRQADRNVQNAPIDPIGSSSVAPPAIPLDGVWQAVDLEFVGGATPQEHDQLSQQCRWIVAGGRVRIKWQNVPLVTAGYDTDQTRQPFGIDFTVDEGPQAIPAGETPGPLEGVFVLRDGVLEVCTGRAATQRPAQVKSGLVTREPADDVTFRAGLSGYARLLRMARSFEQEELQGRWVVVSTEAGVAELPVDAQSRQAVVFDDNRYVLEFPEGADVRQVPGRFALEAVRPAQFMDMIPAAGETMHCLYEVEGDTLRLCMAAPGAPRPTEFKTQADQLHVTFVFRRDSIPPAEQ